MSKETVDIILPTYHPNLTLLKRAVESIIGQQYQNWVLYLIQDGEDCDVLSLVNSFNDSRINYFEIPHCGKAAALNFALQKGSSKYIAYQDDDDIWYPNHLSECIHFMQSNNAGFVHSDAYEVFISVDSDHEYKETSRRKLHRGLITDWTLYYISHINVVHTRELLDKVGLYDVSLKFYIDWDMLQRLAQQTKPYHLSVFTCEHYIYTNVDGLNMNTISSVHTKNVQLHEEKTRLMFKKSFEILNADNYLKLLKDIEDKERDIIAKEQEITKYKEKLNQIFASRSWKIARAMRFVFSLIKK